MNIPEIYNLDTYDFELPEDLIAQNPVPNREGSRLLVLDRYSGEITTTTFANIKNYLPANSLLVANNTKVLPARVLGKKETGGKVEFLLLTPFPLLKPQKHASGWFWVPVEGLIKASKRPKPGQKIIFGPDFYLIIQEEKEFGRIKGLLFFQKELKEKFLNYGHMPLPPYIQRPDSLEDKKHYQTVYAADEKLGAVAAPTAGLHFTPKLIQNLTNDGLEFEYITLFVGYGTFSPVRSQDIREHKMHPEYVEVSVKAAHKISQAQKQGRPIVAIGTTTVRTLEGVHAHLGKIAPFSGPINLFIYPGYKFQIIDHLITNFHLPRSSLFMLVSAFAGLDKAKQAYQTAIQQKFRFFSYGDAMLIL
ncbi:MAG: tRNA preQ1(34) S-adenosylmethionine ribosyltransferase-isomerase QueA [Desulfonauticus sp.]|nr:tRNA preQ1(34) S-adenosylmethionine ribosyltransferase-isomerase QueA [Desulfonauticus sp.]